jgi:hypothetical protein
MRKDEEKKRNMTYLIFDYEEEKENGNTVSVDFICF